MLLIVVAGSAYAADDSQSKITDSLDDDFEFEFINIDND